MGDDGRWARCNFDGKPLHPDDQEIVDTFREWLALPAERRRDPEWHEFLGIAPRNPASEGPEAAGCP